MKNICVYLALSISSFATFAAAQTPATEKKPYTLVVWADLSFDENSQLSQITIQEKDTLPKAFVSYLMNTVASTSFATPDTTRLLETGLKIMVEIDPVTSKASVLSQAMMPRPTRSENLAEPQYKLKGEWSGRIFVTCSISDAGRCQKPKIDRTTNAPDQLPKVLLATLGTWRFVPQKRAGKAVAGEFGTWVTIEADTTLPPKSFGKQI